ncbi:MAG: hypothetical protein K6G12_03375 [Lachnospiraceae bacterium]|nr:hypothetical protein [Lachnospiraceae bacterium]
MKKGKTKDKLNIVLDLTSLLDVILIVLIVVMCNRDLNTKQVDEVNAQLSDAQSTIEMYESHQEDLESIDDKVAFVTLYVDFDESDPSVRHIKMMIGDDLKGFEPFDITSSDEDQKYGELKENIDSFMTSHTDIPVWVTIDDANILYRDWEKIGSMMQDLKTKYPNLYVNDKLVIR